MTSHNPIVEQSHNLSQLILSLQASMTLSVEASLEWQLVLRSGEGTCPSEGRLNSGCYSTSSGGGCRGHW